MAAADLFSLLREEVKCAICLDQLRKPRVLTCLHSFCEKCLETYKEEKSTAGKITCPVCDEETELTDAGILGLRQDFRAITLMERLEKEKPKQQQKMKVTKLCEVCGYIDSDLASSFFYCAECQQVLCRECADKHDHLVSIDASMSISVAETSLEKNDDQQKRIYCEKHGGKKRDLLCTFCLISVCNECSVSDHCPENNHKCVPVEDFVPVMREEIQSQLSNLAQVSKQCASIFPKIKNAEDLVKKQRDILDKQFDNDIDEYIHCMKTDLRVRNEKFSELRNQKLGQWQKIIEDRAESIEKIQVKAEEALKQGENSSLIAALYKDLMKSFNSLLSLAPEKYILNTINKVMEVRRLHFRLVEDKSLIGAQIYTQHDVCGRRIISIRTNDDDDLRAMIFTRDGKLAVLASFSGPSDSKTTSSYFECRSGNYSKITQELYEHCRYLAVKQTTVCSEVASEFGIELRLEHVFDYPGSALASLSDLRFVLGESNIYIDMDDAGNDFYHVTKLPGPISDMATDLKDNIFCSVPSYHKIYVVRNDGPQTKSIPTGDLTPQDIAVCPRSPDQIMFTHDSKVSVIDWDGKLLSTITRPEWKDVAIGCDNDRLLYVLWKNEAGLRTLQRFHLNGELLDTLFEGETHSFSKLLLAVSPRGTAAVVTTKGSHGRVTLISATREFTGDETCLPK